MPWRLQARVLTRMVAMAPAKPSLDLLRSLTDEHVLRALMEQRRLTRAQLAARTGLSKPTVSDSVRRLCEAGLLADTGERTTGRGRVGSYYGLAEDIGSALVVNVAPEGIVAELLDAHGDVISTATADVARPAQSAQVVEALTTAARTVQKDVSQQPRLAVVSAADPVDRATGRLVHLPDSPFLLGELSPTDVLAGLVDGPVMVDNDVNWAARAERDATDSQQLDDFAYLHLGEGLGCAVVNDGVVRRGHAGLVGEIAHVLATGPDGRAVPSSTCSARCNSAILHRRRSTCPHCWRRSDATMRRHAICGQPWPGRYAASSPPWSPSATPQSSSSAGRGAPSPSSSTPSPRSSSGSPAMSRSGPRDSPTHPPSPVPGTTHSTSFKRRSPPPPDRHEPERARQWPAPGPPRHS